MTDDVLTFIEGRVGRIRLNRPKAIHALTHPMCDKMLEALVAWQDDDAVDLVLIDHSEGRGFCAGGDIRALAESAAIDGIAARAFFHQEYRLNHLLFYYPKPTVAIMDGITMGGGCGISEPCRYRVATERTMYAMPETGIGLFTDVGGGWYLSRLSGRMGQYLGVTGARINGAETFGLGITNAYVASDDIEALKAAIIAKPAALETLLAEKAGQPGDAPILARRGDIDRLFASDRYEDVLAALAADSDEWATKTLVGLQAKSPQACKVVLRLLAEAAKFDDFADEMRLEYAVGARVIHQPDFVEGVRAVIVDKDNAPRWNPATPEGVSDALIDSIFAPLPAADAWSPLPKA